VTPARTRLAVCLLALALAGCGGSSEPPATTAAAATTSAPVETEPPTTEPSATTTAPTATTTATATTLGFRAACTSKVLLAHLKKQLDDPARELVVDRVEVDRCRNGYVHVYAIPRMNPPDHPQYDPDQLWLRYRDGTWTTVAEGSGIACSDTDIDQALLTACRALGERG
jgi:hypothetical protein